MTHKSILEMRGIPIVWKKQPTKHPKRLWMYHPWKKHIILYERANWLSKEKFNLLLEHEWAHYIYWEKMSKVDVAMWEWVSQLDAKTKSWLAEYMPWAYFINKYISPWETNESEDFAEVWEDVCRNKEIVYWDNRDFDRLVVKKLINKYNK